MSYCGMAWMIPIMASLAGVTAEEVAKKSKELELEIADESERTIRACELLMREKMRTLT